MDILHLLWWIRILVLNCLISWCGSVLREFGQILLMCTYYSESECFVPCLTYTFQCLILVYITIDWSSSDSVAVFTLDASLVSVILVEIVSTTGTTYYSNTLSNVHMPLVLWSFVHFPNGGSKIILWFLVNFDNTFCHKLKLRLPGRVCLGALFVGLYLRWIDAPLSIHRLLIVLILLK